MNGLDFSARMKTLCRDMAGRTRELNHIDMDRVAVAVVQTRINSRHGTYATLTPLRFEGGELEGVVHGRRHRMQRVFDEHGREALYILSFFLPRFLDQLSVTEKLETVVHELWHIGPRFDGDLRRFPGRCYAHGPSEKEYDAEVARLTRRWLAAGPPASLYGFLHGTFAAARARYGAIHGLRIRHPKLIPVGPAGPPRE